MPSAELDHILPVADGGDLWDTANMSALCKICHEGKTAAENTGRQAAAIPGRAAWRKRVNRLTGDRLQ